MAGTLSRIFLTGRNYHMNHGYIPRIKICCITTREEARLAIECGAHALGLVGHMPSGPGVISDERIRDIATIVPPPVAAFLLTSETTAPRIIAHHRKVNTNTIQLVDRIDVSEYPVIREALPGIKLVQVIHVFDTAAINEAVRCSHYVDAILLDSGNPGQRVKELGGTGRTHNWEISKHIRDSISIPLFLAGGLNPGNVRRAIDAVKPFGVDVCTGVRTDGKLDKEKLVKFVKATRME
jgi:phosphoribosylanthranilate isomerase